MISGLPPSPDGHDPDAIFYKSLHDDLTFRRRLCRVDGMAVAQTSQGDYALPGDLETGGGGGVRVKLLVLRDVLNDYLICRNVPKGPAGTRPHWIGQFNADPGSPADNDAYFNFSDGVFKIFAGSAWVAMTADADWKQVAIGGPVAQRDIYVAKPAELRTSLKGEVILGTAHTFTYSDGPAEDWSVGNDTRFNLVRTDDEDERVVKPYVEGELIHAISATTGLFRPKLDAHGDQVLDEHGNPIFVAISLLEIKPSRQWAGPVEDP
jgi:hypothetical protein